MKTITLGNKVVVSDPCYEIPTWCQAVIDNVLPGTYHTNVVKSHQGDWGNRCSHLIAIHSDYYKTPEDLQWEESPHEIGVDSGQAGIFSFESYRNDNHKFDTEPHNFGDNWDREDGDKWYRQMCGRTLDNEHWGTYDQGIVSSSGYGDGGYVLHVAKENDKIVGFIIDFLVVEELVDNVVYDTYMY